MRPFALFLLALHASLASQLCFHSSAIPMTPDVREDLKRDLRIAIDKLTPISTRFSTENVEFEDLEKMVAPMRYLNVTRDYLSEANPLPDDVLIDPFLPLNHTCIPRDDEDLNDLLRNVSAQFAAIAQKLETINLRSQFADMTYRLYLDNEACIGQADVLSVDFALNRDGSRRSEAFSVAFALQNNKSLDAARTQTAIHDDHPYLAKLLIISRLRFEDCVQQRFMYSTYETTRLVTALPTTALCISALAKHAIRNQRSALATEHVRREFAEVKRLENELTNYYYSNALDRVGEKLREVIKAEYHATRFQLNLEVLKGKVERMLENDFANPRQEYGVFIRSTTCRLVSHAIVFANDSSAVRVYRFGNLQVLLYRILRGAAAEENRRVFEAQKSAFEDVLDVRTAGRLFVTVTLESAAENMARLRELHEFPFVASLVFEESEDVCAVACRLENVAVVKMAKTGSFFTAERKFGVVALFGV